MARSASLNPASMPFSPSGIRAIEGEGGNPSRWSHENREQDRRSASTQSLSPSEYRSAKSSPSPPRVDRNNESMGQTEPSPAPAATEGSRNSPRVRHFDAVKSYPAIENRVTREASMLGSLDALPEAEGPSGATASIIHVVGPLSLLQQQQQANERQVTPPVSVNSSSRASFHGNSALSTSPVSSLDSASQFASSIDQSRSFESQLTSSPLIHDILERLARCEFSTREIQRDLGDVHRKVNLLVERSLGISAVPEFKDPFAPVNANAQRFSPPLNGQRPSMGGNIAPNQAMPSDDIIQISQRLNTLTTSVGQLLAMQTQQRIHPASNLPNTHHHLSNVPPDLGHNPIMGSQLPSNPNVIGHGLPSRPEMRSSSRAPNHPMRTWSAGTLDLPMRSIDPGPGRQEGSMRDKRRSASGLSRRESSGVIDPQGDASRDLGPMISKWEQLALAPELLRSLAKFGVGPPNKIQQRALPFLLRGADIIAQAPPTQERIAAYVIPAIQIAVTHSAGRPPNKGPIVVMISTTVDQATQAQRMIRDLGGPIGIRSALGVGTSSVNHDLSQEIRLLQQNMPHIICGTPQKLHALFSAPGGLVGSEVRFLVLDEVDQLIARNLHEFVFSIVSLLPPPRSRPVSSGAPAAASGPGSISVSPFSTFEIPGNVSALPTSFQSLGRRMSTVSIASNTNTSDVATAQPAERQTALFSNTVPQDVLNLASSIQLREPVRVLVRRDGNVTNVETNQGSRGLRQFYLYLAFTASGRSDPTIPVPGGGLGIIGSGRGASNAESAQAREWKLDALADLFDDVEVTQVIVHVGGITALDAVVYKLASRGLEAIPLHGDMNAGTKLAALNKFRSTTSILMRQPVTKVLVVYDVQVKTPEVSHVQLIINYDLPKAVEEYAHRVAPGIASNHSRAGVVVNFVTATGGDVEMLRSIECFYKIKCVGYEVTSQALTLNSPRPARSANEST